MKKWGSLRENNQQSHSDDHSETINSTPKSTWSKYICLSIPSFSSQKSNEKKVPLYLLILLGQFLSICICGTAITSSLLGEMGKQFPIFLSLLNYFLLFIFYGVFYFTNNQEQSENNETSYHTKSFIERIKEKKYLGLYFILALIDFEANFLLILSYQYTSMLTVMLLDGFAIPCVVLFGFLLYRFHSHSLWIEYTGKWLYRIVGIVLCLGGLGLLVYSDSLRAGKEEEKENAMYGDLLVLIGASLYALSNLLQEYLIKSRQNRTELLFLLGFFGLIIGSVQFSVIELQTMVHTYFPPLSFLYMSLFALSLFSLYSLTPILMHFSSAAFFNLSLLTSDFYGALISFFFFGMAFSWIYILAFLMIVFGLIVYHLYSNTSKGGEIGVYVSLEDSLLENE